MEGQVFGLTAEDDRLREEGVNAYFNFVDGYDRSMCVEKSSNQVSRRGRSLQHPSR